MHIVFVDWLIMACAKTAFLDYWKAELPIEDRSKMIGEFLSEPSDCKAFPWIKWDLHGEVEHGVIRFVNVGLWADAEAFHEQVGRYFDPDKGKLNFEHKLRRRALLKPKCWRMGDWKLPIHDSGGVV
jgi:hypothetical protein